MSYFLSMLLVGFSMIIVLTIVVSIYTEYKEWNGGVCPHTGGSWVYHKEDENGARVYKNGRYTLTVSWPYIDDHVDQ